MTPPRVFWAFANYWRLPQPVTRLFWHALSHAQWSRAIALRQTILLYSSGPGGDRKALIHGTCCPREIMAVVEDLVQEQCLSRAKANQLEEAILACVKADGTWR